MQKRLRSGTSITSFSEIDSARKETPLSDCGKSIFERQLVLKSKVISETIS